MSKTTRRLILLLAFASVFFFAVCACAKGKPKSKLSAPQNLRMDGKILVWDNVDNARGYTVYFSGAKHETAECRYDLSELTKGTTYSIQVRSLGDGKSYTDSDWVRFSYMCLGATKAGYDDKGFEYHLLEAGSGYEISKGKVDVTKETQIVIPESYNGLPVKSIAPGGFAAYPPNSFPKPEANPFTGKNCNNTTKVIHLPETLESIGTSAFTGYTNLEEIVIPDAVTEIGESAFKHCINLKKVTLPNKLKKISNESFFYCALTEISFPNTLEEIGNKAFYGSSKASYSGQTFTKIVIPSSVKSIGTGAFYGCKELVEVILPNSLNTIGSFAFCKCENLEKIVIPSSVKSIGIGAFDGCKKLKEIVLSSDWDARLEQKIFDNTAWYNEQPDGVLYLGHIVYGYKGDMPENTSIHISEMAKWIAGGAFCQQKNLKSIYLPDGIKFNGNSTFLDCSSLSEVRLPSDLEEIPNGTFSKCESLIKIEIPGSVKTIKSTAFSNCKALKEVTIPKSLETLGVNLFKSCSSLTAIYYEGTATEWNALVAQNNNEQQAAIAFSNATVYCYSETKPIGSGNYWHYVDGKAVIWD